MASDRPTGDELMHCILTGEVDKLDDMVKHGADVSFTTNKGMSVLHIAARAGIQEMMVHLLKEYPYCVKKGRLLDKQFGYNALHHWCANHGNVTVFQLMIEKGFDGSAPTEHDESPLILARNTRNEELVQHIEHNKMILQTDVNSAAMAKPDETPLGLAKDTGNSKELVNHKRNQSNGHFCDEQLPLTALHHCALNGNALECLTLIENNKGADVMKLASSNLDVIHSKRKTKNLPSKVTPMELACYCENLRVLRILTKCTDERIIQKCLTNSSGKTTKSILDGIKSKLCHIHKIPNENVVLGTLDDIKRNPRREKMFTVYSKTLTHGTESTMAGYRVLYRNPTICETNGVDEGRAVMRHCQDKGCQLKDMEREQIEKAISQESGKLWNKHSNIRGFLSSPVKYSKGEFLRKHCLVIVCLFKSFIPEGEEDFPKSILVDGKFIAVDVREGCFQQAGNVNPLGKHIPLRMGCTIGPNDKYWFGTLGPAVRYHGRLCYLTCAHVLFPDKDCQEKANEYDKANVSNGQSRLESKQPGLEVLQPAKSADQVVEDSELDDRKFGRVIMWDYAINRPTSIDIAVMEVTSQDRIPQTCQFTAYDKSQFEKTGYRHGEPTFDSGRTGVPTSSSIDVTQETESSPGAEGGSSGSAEFNDGVKGRDHNADNNILLFGCSSGPTSGKYKNTAKVQFTTKLCGRTDVNERYNGMQYIHHSQCGEDDCKLPPMAKFGDSGAGVFQRLDDNTLVCIGVLVAVDNTDSALVTPIQPILDHFGLTMASFE
ncbi:uncharacterized protein [Argopecten irradians]|uniref:uncharacterized protein n=1 Tax=Argopecten irradians TaxID=31199 RepID=UPI00371B6E45